MLRYLVSNRSLWPFIDNGTLQITPFFSVTIYPVQTIHTCRYNRSKQLAMIKGKDLYLFLKHFIMGHFLLPFLGSFVGLLIAVEVSWRIHMSIKWEKILFLLLTFDNIAWVMKEFFKVLGWIYVYIILMWGLGPNRRT